MTTSINKASVVLLTDDGGSKYKAQSRRFLGPRVRSRGEYFTVKPARARLYFAREDQRAAAAFLAMARRSFGSRFAALTLPPFAPRLRCAAVAGASGAGLESFSRPPVAIPTMDMASSFVSRGRLGGFGIPQECHGQREASSPGQRRDSN
jgi:hypothetical protein